MKWTKANIKHTIAISVILIMHIVGIFGLNSANQLQFAQLTPINLLVTFIALLFTVQYRSVTFWIFFCIAFLIGMLVEVIGVKTGFPFGTYYYPELLSLQVFEVPVLIGINWFILSYIIISFINMTKLKAPIFKIILASLIMTGLDMLIEPFAIKYGLWVWESNAVPLSNYIAWFFISSLIFSFGFPIFKNKLNITAVFTLLVYFVFFTLNLLF